MHQLQEFFKTRYNSIINSIAFLPMLITAVFVFISAVMINFDYSETGRDIKSNIRWLRLQDASTARSILQAIAAGIISLTVFSFSMVMVVLNQAASNMSNRILDKLIGNRFQQSILGIYVGTILFALFLLTTIRDIDSGVYIPALSIYFLIVLTVIDLFLFVYFLHYITESIKYTTIINRVKDETERSIRKYTANEEEVSNSDFNTMQTILSPCSDIYHGFDKKRILKICSEHDLIVYILWTPGSFVLKETELIHLDKKADAAVVERILDSVYFHRPENIANDYKFGFRQLTEIALKALSPGLNDPGTAIEALRSLFELLRIRISHSPPTRLCDDEGSVRIITAQDRIEDIFNKYIMPVWDYAKNDRMITLEFLHLLKTYLNLHPLPAAQKLYHEVSIQDRSKVD